MTLTLEGHRKYSTRDDPSYISEISIYISEAMRLQLEKAEIYLQTAREQERIIEAGPQELKVATSSECGPLSDCQLRVYRNPIDQRCHFHLVGHTADNSLVYSNSVLIDNLI